MTDTTTTTTICAATATTNTDVFRAANDFCARAIGHNGGHTTAAQIAHYGNAHAAQTAINGTAPRAIWAAIAAIATIAF